MNVITSGDGDDYFIEQDYPGASGKAGNQNPE